MSIIDGCFLIHRCGEDFRHNGIIIRKRAEVNNGQMAVYGYLKG